MSDPYVYPGTSVLLNKLDIDTAEALEMAERRYYAARLRTLSPERIELSPDGFRAIHKHLFQDVYEWAGTYREINMSKGGDAPFCAARFIAAHMEKRFHLIGADAGLESRDPTAFARAASEHINELNAIHPFREGNGRIMRQFLRVLAGRAGHELDLRRIDRQKWMEASIIGFHRQDYGPKAELIEQAVAGRSEDRNRRLKRRRPSDQDRDRDRER